MITLPWETLVLIVLLPIGLSIILILVGFYLGFKRGGLTVQEERSGDYSPSPTSWSDMLNAFRAAVGLEKKEEESVIEGLPSAEEYDTAWNDPQPAEKPTVPTTSGVKN